MIEEVITEWKSEKRKFGDEKTGKEMEKETKKST